jgi:23S rRNA (adenine2503-C2)-methyltransferase
MSGVTENQREKLPDQREELVGKTRQELTSLMAEMGEKPYRAGQLYEAIYRRRLAAMDQMTELPRSLRALLGERALITRTRVAQVFVAQDGTRRLLLRLADGAEIEAVFMPERHRDTICLSTQVGCPLACDFCMTGVLGLKRNMTVNEILSQVVVALNEVYGPGSEPSHGTNIVIMGMGEPLLNYDEVMKAVRLLTDTHGLDITARRITLSTAGIVPRIYDLARESVRPRLAISLTAATDELRDRLFPINRKYPLAELMEACRVYPLGDRERLTFEYVMLKGVNDSDRDARDLVRLLNKIRAKVNLIPHNPAPELPYAASDMDRIIQFQQVLVRSGLASFIRRPRGQDISAACGQLAARHQAV